MPSSDPLVVVAVSGRALAQSAARSHGPVVILDAFADADTRRTGTAVNVGLNHGIGIDGKRMLAALAQATSDRNATIVVGSGFERSPHWLDRMARHGRLCANDSSVVRALKDPDIVMKLLRAQGWNVPETQRMPPSTRSGWLQKRVGGAGGIHVRRAAGRKHAAHHYYQREVDGIALSVTFLADGERAYVLGCNRLLSVTIGTLPWCHAGIVSGVSLSAGLRATLQDRLDRLVRVTGLRGLNGLDFLMVGDDAVALEVNPRPTASFELYDADYEEGLVHWHIASFAGPLREFVARTERSTARALRVVYADRDMAIPDGEVWPDWCRDQPGAGTSIAAGAPVLTVTADGGTPEAAQVELDRRAESIRRQVARYVVHEVVVPLGAPS